MLNTKKKLWKIQEINKLCCLLATPCFKRLGIDVASSAPQVECLLKFLSNFILEIRLKIKNEEMTPTKQTILWIPIGQFIIP